MNTTKDIIVEFSSSLDANGNFKQYHAVSGTAFSDDYNETLDSATIILDNIPLEDRLSHIKPYDFVRVYDITSLDTDNPFDKVFLLDNFNEEEINIYSGTNFFQYNIALMSLTKLLEKVQCPNLVVTHTVNEDGTTNKQTIYEIMSHYLELYAPKVKTDNGDGTWQYKPLYTIPAQEENGIFFDKFNVTSADLTFTAPTLRQVLTSLMQQVGCIPTLEMVNNEVKLGYLDFNAPQVEFGNGDYKINNTVNRIQRSLSSDSYANTLVNMSSNVLDSGNEVISETLGFRDSSGVFLNQQSNLMLETRFPIYKIEKATIKTRVKYRDFVNVVRTLSTLIDPRVQNKNWFCYAEFNYTSSGADIKLYGGTERCYIHNLTVHYCKKENNVFVHKTESLIWDLKSVAIHEYTTYNLTFSHNTYDFIWMEYEISSQEKEHLEVKSEGRLGYLKDINSMELRTTGVSDVVGTQYSLFTFDFSDFIVEQGKRKTLETNFNKMPSNVVTTDDATRFVYGTVEYTIGSNKITGFSQTYSVGQRQVWGWFETDKTYIENIMEKIFELGSFSEELVEVISQAYGGMPVLYKGLKDTTVYVKNINCKRDLFNFSTLDFSSTPTFFSLLFDITYQPLNTFNLAFVKSKEDIPFAIEQFDSGASGTTDFDRLSIHEQENVDRIGNETLSIAQRTSNFGDIQPLPSVFKDDLNRDGDYDDPDDYTAYTVFKRTFTINNYNYNVQYTASKDAILKNYFTSIRTKYRAYQYVDYNQSVERKEKDIIYVRIGEDYYDGDDKVWLGAWGEDGAKDSLMNYFWSGVLYPSNDTKIKYEVDCGIARYVYDFATTNQARTSPEKETEHSSIYSTQNQKVKNELSIVTNSNGFSFIYNNTDNVGGGTYIRHRIIGEDDNGGTSSGWLQIFDGAKETMTVINAGGLEQNWQIWSDSFSLKHNVLFVFDILELNLDYTTTQDTEAKEIFRKTTRLPIVNYDFGLAQGFVFDNGDKTNWEVSFDNLQGFKDEANYDLIPFDSNKMAIAIMDKNDGVDFNRTFYKDLAECINHTVQFIYYSTTPNIKWTEEFISGNGFINRHDILEDKYAIVDVSEQNWNDLALNTNEKIESYNENIDLTDLFTINGNKLTVNWSELPNGCEQFKVVKVLGLNTREEEYEVEQNATIISQPGHTERTVEGENYLVGTVLNVQASSAGSLGVRVVFLDTHFRGKDDFVFVKKITAIRCKLRDSSLSYTNNSFVLIYNAYDVQTGASIRVELETYSYHEIVLTQGEIEGTYIDSSLIGSNIVGLSFAYNSSPIVNLINKKISFDKVTGTITYSAKFTGFSQEVMPIKISYKKIFGNTKDIIAFKKGDSNSQDFFVSLNDTKSDYVMALKNGVLYKKGKVATQTSGSLQPRTILEPNGDE